MSTDVSEFISDLDGGAFESALSGVLSDVAGAVIEQGRAGEVTVKLKFKQIGSSHQVQCEHELKYKQPTKKGNMVEDMTTMTPLYVGTKGKLSFFPENQNQFFGKNGEIQQQKESEE